MTELDNGADLFDAERMQEIAYEYCQRKANERRARRDTWLTVLAVVALGMTLFGALSHASPVEKITHDAVFSEYCGAC
jgi:hypothetical protein